MENKNLNSEIGNILLKTAEIINLLNEVIILYLKVGVSEQEIFKETFLYNLNTLNKSKLVSKLIFSEVEKFKNDCNRLFEIRNLLAHSEPCFYKCIKDNKEKKNIDIDKLFEEFENLYNKVYNHLFDYYSNCLTTN